ncbi:MAG: 23S rRNA (uracil(1939)-C(5))-methyltransferase RlmD [Cyclobacteriaceae bacterium]
MGRKGNKLIENVTIEGIAAEGKCIARVDDKVIFVSYAAPGDVADIWLTKKRKNYAEAKIQTLHTPSDLRIEPICSHFSVCGGCKWQHIPYAMQIEAKEQQVTDALQRIGKVELPTTQPIIPSIETTHYRNKLEYTFTSQRWLTDEEIRSDEKLERNAVGFHVPGKFDKVLDVDTCYLQGDLSNQVRNFIKKYALENAIPFFNIVQKTGNLRNLIIRNTSIDQWMVIVQLTEWNSETEKLLTAIDTKFPDLTSLNYVVNTKGNETFHDLDVICFKGSTYIEEEMEELRFRISPKSFFQTNSKQAYILYQKTRELADLTGNELVYDLYTGTGTIANFIASKAKKVVGIEYVEAAIEDAKVNSEINGISNTDFFAGDMKDLLTEEFVAKNGKPDVIITDPPRAGMHTDVVNQLIKLRSPKIVYVSCNASTQARDLELLDSTYKVTHVQPVDMFPHTHHVENVVLLELKK